MPRDVLLVLRYAIEPTLRSPLMLILGLFQPVLYLVLFGPLLSESDIAGASGERSWQVFLPGVLMMLAMFGAGFAGFALIPDQRAGVLERMRVSPMSRSALLLGRVLREVVVVLAQAVVLIGLAVALFGLRISPVSALLGLLLLGVLSVALASVSYALALKLPNEYEFAPVVQNLSIPLLLLSGFLIPMEAGPEWLRMVSRINPMTWVLDAERSLFLGEPLSSRVLLGSVIAVALAAIALLWGSRTFRRAHA